MTTIVNQVLHRHPAPGKVHVVGRLQQFFHYRSILHHVQRGVKPFLSHSVLLHDGTTRVAEEVVEHEAQFLIAELSHVGSHCSPLIRLGGIFRIYGIDGIEVQFGAHNHKIIVIGSIVKVAVGIDVCQCRKGEINVGAIVVQVDVILTEIQMNVADRHERRYIFQLDELDKLVAVIHRIGSQIRSRHPHQIHEAGIGHRVEVVSLYIHRSHTALSGQFIEVALTRHLHPFTTTRHDPMEVLHRDIRHTGHIAVEA